MLSMLKITLALAALVSLPQISFAAVTEAQLKTMVDNAAADIKKDSKSSLEKINTGDAKYRSPEDKGVYVFVYDMKLKMMAHPDKNLVGKDLNNKPDVCGCMFRNEIVNRISGKKEATKCKENADKEFVNYVYKNPEKGTLEHKKTYYKAVKGSDNVEYIVLAGLYVKEMKGCEK